MPTTWTFEELARAERAKHEELVSTRPAPTFESLVGWEWRGWNALYPVPAIYMKLTGYQRFIKGFFRRAGGPDPATADKIHGYNLQITRGRLDEPWEEVRKHGDPVRHSFFDVYRPGGGRRFTNRYAQAAYLDYAVAENGVFDGRDIRDFLVAVSEDLLLGKAYFGQGRLRFPASFFVLERLRKHKFTR